MIYKNHIVALLMLPTLMMQPVMAQVVSNTTKYEQMEKDGGIENMPLILGGPNSVGAQLEEDERIRRQLIGITLIDDTLKPWFDFKSHINKKYGLNIGIDYTVLYQRASESLGEDQAAGGIFGVFGTWTLLGRGTSYPGSLVFLIENRHRLGTDIAPQLLGLETGYLGVTGSLFIDAGWVLPTLYWEQLFNNGLSGFAVGRIDPGNFIDVSGYANPLTNFQNSAILGNATIPIPNPGLGIVGSTYLPDQWYLLLGFFDSNGKLNDVNFTTFFEEVEYFKYVEFGWSPSPEENLNNNFHVTVWHADGRDKAEVDESWGITGSINWLFNDRWMPFFRVGWSDGTAPLMNKALNIGITYYLASRADGWGVGIAWGDPSDDTLHDQTTTEIFYRIQLTQGVAVTPSLQWIFDPALNPDESDLWVMGLRIRFNM
jgi:porin